MKWAKLIWDHRFLQTMHALYIPSLWVKCFRLIVGIESVWKNDGHLNFENSIELYWRQISSAGIYSLVDQNISSKVWFGHSWQSKYF